MQPSYTSQLDRDKTQTKFTSQKKYKKISSENINHESRRVYIRLLIKHCIKSLTHSLRKSLTKITLLVV